MMKQISNWKHVEQVLYWRRFPRDAGPDQLVRSSQSPTGSNTCSSSTNFHAEQFQIYGLMYISLIGRLNLADSTPRWEEDCAPGARIIAPKPLRGQTHLGCSLAPKGFRLRLGGTCHGLIIGPGLLNPRQADNCNNLLIGQTHVGLSLML